jgi:hypothetical protein
MTDKMLPPRVPGSDPPSVKISHGHNALAQNVALGCLLTFAFCTRKDFLVEWYVGAMLGGFGVVNLPVLLGKPRGSIGGITLLASMPKLVSGAVTWLARGHAGPFMALALAVACSGCAGMDLPSPETARIAANKSAQAMNRLGPVIAAACATEPPPWCGEAITAYNDVGAAHRLLQDWIDLYGLAAQ